MNLLHADQRLWSAVAAVALLLGGTALWWAPMPEAPAPLRDAPPAPTLAAPTTLAPADTAAGPSGRHSHEALARSFELGVAGDLALDLNTKATLDLLLAELGPLPADSDLQQLEATLQRSLPARAATEAMALVRHYLDYQRAVAADASLQQPPDSAEAQKILRDKTEALRDQHFGRELAQTLFGTADAAAPASLMQTELEERLATLRRQGAPEAELARLRTQYLGADAAAALGESDAQRALWEQRHQAYREQKRALLAGAPADPKQGLEALLRQHYSPEELAAARAYDQRQAP